MAPEVVTPKGPRKSSTMLPHHHHISISFADQKIKTTTGRLLASLDARNASMANPNPASKPRVKLFQDAFSNGGLPIGGPMLVLEGLADETLSVAACNRAVADTAARFPESKLEYY